MTDINPFWLGSLGGFINALFTYLSKNFLNPPKDAKIDHYYEVKLLVVLGISYALAGGILAALLALSDSPPVWFLVIGVTAPPLFHKLTS